MFFVRFGSVFIYTTIYKSNVTVYFFLHMLCTFGSVFIYTTIYKSNVTVCFSSLLDFLHTQQFFVLFRLWSSSTQQYINQMSLCNYLLFFIHALYFSARSSSTQQYINQMSLCNYVIFFIHALYVSAQSSTQQYINQMSL